MTDITVILMFIMAVGVTVMLTVFGIAMFRSAQQAEKKAAQSARNARPDATPAEPPKAQWSPPRYDAAPAGASGASVRVGLAVVQPQDASLLITWNAVNDGGEPVMIQWGSPEVRLDHAGGVQLWYAYTASDDQAFVAPETRLCGPGEIVSRTLTLPAATLGGTVRGLKLSLVVGYGAAASYSTACTDPGAYGEWQQRSVSLPRTVPAA